MDGRDWKILRGNAEQVLKTLADKSIDCCVTSPPYYALRDYGTAKWIGGDENCDHVANPNATKKQGNAEFNKNRPSREETKCKGYYKDVCPKCGAVRVDEQIGLEETPEEYIDRLVSVFHEVKRVLKDDGTLWVNIGDSYNGNKKGNTESVKSKSLFENQGNFEKKKWDGCKEKDLIGIPWELAFALRNDGWYLRQDIIWAKPNCMPESVKDRCTKSHEYIFLLSKSERYYFDLQAIKEPAGAKGNARTFRGGGAYTGGRSFNNSAEGDRESHGNAKNEAGTRNKRDVWFVPTGGGYSDDDGAHFATYPKKLIEPCILSGCPVGGTVLDPFNGSGTTGVVAIENGRNYIGIELNEKYAVMAEKRLEREAAQTRLF